MRAERYGEGKRQAMDSVHVKANASMDSLQEKQILEDGAAYAAALKEDEEDQQDDPVPDPQCSAAKHKSVQQHHHWKDKAYKGRPGSRDGRIKFVLITPTTAPPIQTHG